MKRKPPDSRNALSALRLSLALSLATLVPLLLYGSAPSWWSQRGVLAEQAVADDYAPANQGQLKNIAKAAVLEMDAKLTSGAGETLHHLVSSWSTPTSQTNDFAPVNLGQLKSVAKPFYDKLITLGIVDNYPWLSSFNLSDDLAVANIGQVKNLFSFEIQASNAVNDPIADRIAPSEHRVNLALESNAVWSWNSSNAAQNADFEQGYPRRISGLSGIRSVTAGDRHLVALGVDGTVLTWGENDTGQLGDGTSVTKEAPALLPNLSNIISVKAGDVHTLALQQAGTVLAWGDNYYGQLGSGDTNSSSVPRMIPGLIHVRAIAAGYARSAALTTDGTVWTWGHDHSDGHDINIPNPTMMPDFFDVVDIAVGWEHTVAVKTDGTVWVWGANYSNQLGNCSSSQFQGTPVRVPNLIHVIKVASRYDHSLALTSDGTVWAWGYNFFGQLGDGTSQARRTPVQVSGLTDVIAIATSWNYSLAMKADGTVWTWGFGATGILPGADRLVPQQVGLGLLDTNHNGIDDRWELHFLGNLDQPPEADFDGDGIPNYQEFLRGTNPADYFNGVAPVMELAGGNNQIGDAGTFLTKPFKVRLRTQSGQILVNAPVTFTISDGLGGLATMLNGDLQLDLIVRTDADGEATAYHVLPDAPGTSTRTVASAGFGNASTSTTFRSIVKLSRPSPSPSATPPDPNSSPTPVPNATPGPGAPYRYAIIDLGKNLYPMRMNNHNQVLMVGYNSDGQPEWFRWTNGFLERLNYSEPHTEMFAKDMNDAGIVVGYMRNQIPWEYNAENELQAGLVWYGSEGSKVSAPEGFRSFDPRPGVILYASLTAISNSNAMYGESCTGTVRGFLNSTLMVINAQSWPGPSQVGDVSAKNIPTDPFGSKWEGSTYSISRANSAGQYIGHKFTPNPISAGFIDGESSPMIDGNPISFEPVDINEAGIVIGSAGSDMIVSSPLAPQITISGAIPLAINDHTRLAPSSAAEIPSTPSRVAAPQILARVGNGVAILERQGDGLTWYPFSVEEMIPSADGWAGLTPIDINDNGFVVGSGWYADPSNPSARSEPHAFMLVPVELMVDGNRDGKMSFDDPAVHDADQTNEDKPYRFWVNDDSDGILDGEEVDGGSPDYADIYLKSLRDLEDFSRLWISFKGFTEMVKNGGVTVQLEWKPIHGGTSWPGDAGNPAINVFKAVETDGGNKYVSDEAIAKSQVSYGSTPGEYSISLGRVGRGQPLTLPANFFATLSENQPNKFLLFEGAAEGKGQLVLTLHKHGQKVGEYPPVYLDLKDVRRMYERGKITLDAPQIPDPWDNDNPPPLTWVWDPWNWPPDIDPNAEQKTIAYVHGWRMTYKEYLLWADTTFKRLWHLGYNGRFYSFRWPTYHGDNNGPNPADIYKPGGTTYNPSEYRAWLSGPTLANFVNSLPGSQKYIIAHSMGNVAAGSALRAGMEITRYAMCNAAVAAMAYDQNIVDFNYETPDTDSDQATRSTFGLANKLNPSGTKLVNFSLPGDYALGQWTANNEFFKPQPRLTANYFYRPLNSPSRKLTYEGLVTIRVVTSVAEAMGYVTQSRSAAEGTKQSVGGSINAVINMGSGGFGFGTEHSAEWEFNMQRTYLFWREILHQFDISVPNQPSP